MVVGAICMLGVGYRIGKAYASGIPTTNPLVYTGTLMNNGAPAQSPQNIGISLWTDPTSSTSQVCDVPSGAVTIDALGRFSVPLNAACLTAVGANPDLYVEVDVAGAQVGARTHLGAVPYAVEANHAVSADSAADGGALSNQLVQLANNTFYGQFPATQADGGYVQVTFPQYPSSNGVPQLLPGAPITFTTTQVSTVELEMAGLIAAFGNSSSDEFGCSVQFLLDGATVDSSGDGDAYYGGSVGSTTEAYVTVAALRVLNNVPAGNHSVTVQVNNEADFGTIARCEAASSSPFTVRVTVH
jgi:hypothetical protein